MLIRYSDAKPAIHAFICGISDYTHLPEPAAAPDATKWNLRKLESAAMGAWRFFEWLQNATTVLPLPLGTVELIVAPSQIEQHIEPDLQQYARAAEADAAAFTRAVAEWRDRFADSQESISIFYFAGHGIQRDRGSAILLLRDILANPHVRLENAVNFADVHDGLAPAANLLNIARKQLFFLDTCRAVPTDIGDYDRILTRPLFDTHRAGLDDRQAAPVYFASLYDAKDYALPAQGSLFNRALLQALTSGADVSRGAGATPVWSVTVQSLAHALWMELARLGSKHIFNFGGYTASDPEICALTAAPSVRVLLDFDPRATVETLSSVVLKQMSGRSRKLIPPLIPLPHSIAWPAGFTTLELSAGNGVAPTVLGPFFLNHRNNNVTVTV